MSSKHEGGRAGQALDQGKPEPGAKFERGVVLAWLVEAEGYRAGADWTFTPVETLPGARKAGRQLVDLRAAFESTALPELRIEPTSEGEVRVTSAVPLVVQLVGESETLHGGQAVVVPHGSVVRAGPALIAPLYAEQAESVYSGRMVLPRPAAASFEPGERLSVIDKRAAPRNPRRLLLLVWALAWLAMFPLSAVLVISSYVGYDGEILPRTLVYAVGGVWFLIILGGLVVHGLVSRWVHAGQRNPWD